MSIQLADLAPRLRAQGVKVRYRKLYDLAVSGELPGCQKVRGRWYVDAPLEDVAAAVAAA